MPEVVTALWHHPITHTLWHNWPLTVGTFLYFYQTVIFWQDGVYHRAVMFFGYTIGNVGIMWGVFLEGVLHL